MCGQIGPVGQYTTKLVHLYGRLQKVYLLLIIVDMSELVLIGIHTDPDSAVEEMEALVDVHAAVERRWNTDNILIMGDLNADCKYASGRARERLTLRTDPRFTWLIDDDVDTTTTRTHCAYDRFARTLFYTPVVFPLAKFFALNIYTCI